MRLFLMVLVVCVLLVSAAPGKKDKKKPPRGHGRPDHGPGGGRPDRGPGGGRPGGRPDHGPGGRPEPGHGRPDNGPGGRPEHGQGRPDYRPGGRPDQGPGGRPEHGQGRPELGPRPETPWERPSGWRDPRCRNLECSTATRDSYVCGTDGETYESACNLLQQQCGGRVSADVEVHFAGRCQHPAEAGEPHGHHGPGHHTPHGPGHHTPHGHHGKHPGGRTPHVGDHGHDKHPGGRTPHGGHHGHHHPSGHHHDQPHHSHEHHGRHGYRPHWWPRWRPSWWPEECWDIFDDVFNNTETTDMPVTVPDYVVDGEVPVGPACTAECPIATTENPLSPVCGTNGKTYESSCVLELVACVTDNSELIVVYEGKCIESPIARLSQRWKL